MSGFPPFPGGGGSPGGGGGGGFSLADIFAAILGFVQWLIDTLIYITDWIINHFTEILTLPIVEALAMVKWLIYQIQKGIFQIYDDLRFMLVLAGFLFPEPRDLDVAPWGTALINTGAVHLTGGISPTFNNYPRKWPVRGVSQEYHLVYPDRLRERPHAEPMPKPMHSHNPEGLHTSVTSVGHRDRSAV